MKESKNIKVVVLGNSVAMRVRPVADFPGNLNYTGILRKEGLDVTNLANGGNTVKRAIKDLDLYIRTFPDVYILNFGVVDASTREVPKWFFNLYNSTGQAWYNRFSLFLYNGLIKRVRRVLVYIRFKRTWVSKKKFSRIYALLIERLLKETNAIVIGLSINIADARVEKALPGSKRNHLLYNSIIEGILKDERCFFLDLTDLESESNFPDGVHYSIKGHQIVAGRILEVINNLK